MYESDGDDNFEGYLDEDDRSVAVRPHFPTLVCVSTVESPNKGHFGGNTFVPCKEVVPISKVYLFSIIIPLM